VNIDYQVGELQTLNFSIQQFDAVALIYAHFPEAIKSSPHKMLDAYLREGGTVIFEAFSKKHMDYLAKNEYVGGPKDVGGLFFVEKMQADFSNYEVIEREEKEIKLNKGTFHNGTASVIRFVGIKK
jgi:hypothetical protein